MRRPVPGSSPARNDATPTTPLATLRQDIANKGVELSVSAWEALAQDLTEARFDKRAVIFSQTRIGDRWLFLSHGVAASEQISPEGEISIARFFEEGDLCANMLSTWQRDLAPDQLFAVTPVQGVMVPHALFQREYLHGAAFGLYLRLKVIDALLMGRDLVVAKTAQGTEQRYGFLEQRYRGVIDQVPQALIARFLGITPQGLSRFLKASGRRSR